MIPIRTHTRKPTKADVTKKKPFQDLVGGWLASNAHEMLNRRHLDKETPLDSGNRHHVKTLALWMDRLAAQQFHDDTATSGPQEIRGRCRLSLDKIFASNESRAKWVLERWNVSIVEGRSRGGKHSRHDGVRKGPPPLWSVGNLLPFWDLPARGRAKAVMDATGMCRRTYYALAKDVPAVLSRMERERQEWETTIRPGLDQLLP